MSCKPYDWFALCGGGEKIIGAQVAIADGFRKDAYSPFCERSVKLGAKKLYVSSLDMPDKQIDSLIDYSLNSGASLAVRCGSTLTEMGKIDARFSRSPVMLLYEFGLLSSSTVISGVYLDKDDLSLMAQEEAPLTVLPTADAGCGNGIAPIKAAYERGVKLRIGSGDGLYNKGRNIVYEAAFLRLATAALLNQAEAVPLRYLAAACLSDGAAESEIEQMQILIENFSGGLI